MNQGSDKRSHFLPVEACLMLHCSRTACVRTVHTKRSTIPAVKGRLYAKSSLNSHFPAFTKTQLSFINEKPSTVILGGPGTGKTSAIARKAAHYLQKQMGKPLLVSTTDKSAKQLQQMIDLGSTMTYTSQVFTFYTLATYLLNVCYARQPYQPYL